MPTSTLRRPARPGAVPAGKFALRTRIDNETTVRDIVALLKHYGADDITQRDGSRIFTLGFKHSELLFRLDLPLPDPEDFRLSKTGQHRGDEAMMSAWQKEVNRLFRALHAEVKGRLVGLDDDIRSVSHQFFSDMVVKGGETVYQWHERNAIPAARAGKPMPLLPPPAKEWE